MRVKPLRILLLMRVVSVDPSGEVEVAQEAEAELWKGNTWTRSGRLHETFITQRLGWIRRLPPSRLTSRELRFVLQSATAGNRPLDPLLCPCATTLTTGVATREHGQDCMSA